MVDAVWGVLGAEDDDEILDVSDGFESLTRRIASELARTTIWAVNHENPEETEKVRPVTADPRNLPFPAETMDRAVSVLAIQKIGEFSDIRLALSEVHRVLVPGGRFVLLDVVPEVVEDSDRYVAAIKAAGFTIDSEETVSGQNDAHRLFVLTANRP